MKRIRQQIFPPSESHSRGICICKSSVKREFPCIAIVWRRVGDDVKSASARRARFERELRTGRCSNRGDMQNSTRDRTWKREESLAELRRLPTWNVVQDAGRHPTNVHLLCRHAISAIWGAKTTTHQVKGATNEWRCRRRPVAGSHRLSRSSPFGAATSVFSLRRESNKRCSERALDELRETNQKQPPSPMVSQRTVHLCRTGMDALRKHVRRAKCTTTMWHPSHVLECSAR